MKPIFRISMAIGLTYLIILFSCKKDLIPMGEVNKPPIAIAGIDQTILLPIDSVILDGSASLDPDGIIRKWEWRKTSGPFIGFIYNASGSRTKVKPLVIGTYQFELTITDYAGLTAKDTAIVYVNGYSQPNNPPIAIAGPDQIITWPESTITLNGLWTSDPDQNINSYEWRKISGPNFFNITEPKAIQTIVTNLVEGMYHFELQVTDSGGLFSRDTVQVSVILDNDPPVANAGPDIMITQSPCALLRRIELDGSSSYDPDDRIVYYEWKKITGPGNGYFLKNWSQAILELKSGLYSFELFVKDSRGLSSRDTMVVDASEWLLHPYDLDITLNGTYHFLDNEKYDDDNYVADITEINASGNFAPIGQFFLKGGEFADSATLSINHYTSFQLSASGENIITPDILNFGGKCTVFFKQVIQDGEGSFNGTFEIAYGTASPCSDKVYENLLPLTVTGKLDTNSHQINLTIKGRIYL